MDSCEQVYLVVVYKINCVSLKELCLFIGAIIPYIYIYDVIGLIYK